MRLCQDQFDRSLRDLLVEVPEDLGADPADEHQRGLALKRIRERIAKRWIEVLGSKDKVPNAKFTQMVESTNATIAKMIEIHGQNIAFCLPPSEKQLSCMDPEENQTAAESVSNHSSGSGSNILPHEFKFLINAKSVWSVCEAWGLEKKTGYIKQGLMGNSFQTTTSKWDKWLWIVWKIWVGELGISTHQINRPMIFVYQSHWWSFELF